MSRAIIDREHVGRLMHESWSRTKRAQGFHGPTNECERWSGYTDGGQCGRTDFSGSNDINPPKFRCEMFHADLIPWDDLPEKQKDINRHAFDVLLPYFERLLADERERVKKVCAEKIETTIYYREVDILEMDTARLREQIAKDIRQLDLTKPESDLAPSTEEKGNG